MKRAFLFGYFINCQGLLLLLVVEYPGFIVNMLGVSDTVLRVNVRTSARTEFLQCTAILAG